MTRTSSNIVIIACLAAAAGCSDLEGNGQLVRETRELSDFTDIESDGPLDVQVLHGDETAVVVAIDSNLQPYVYTEVRQHTLSIRTDSELSSFAPGPHILVTLPHLRSANAAGSGKFEARTFDETDTVRLYASGSGPFAFAGSAPRIEAVAAGSGDMHLSGSAGDVHFSVSGSGDVDAREVQADNGYAKITGSGNVSATVNGLADAEIFGSGNVDLYGDVVMGYWYVLGTGDVRVH